MGCYLSTVDDKVYLTEGKGRNFTWATASCQGWRREQEDAEACITDFDENASLFVLCDGHGGAEVAKYTVAHLPDFIKNHELYKSGDYKKALEQAFIDFDALLRTDDVMDELKKLAFDEVETKEEEQSATKIEAMDEPQAEISAGPSASGSGAGSGSSSGYQTASTSGSGQSRSNGSSSVAEDVDHYTLRREAEVPIAELMLKYAQKLPKSRVQSLGHSALGASPVIRSREAGDEPEPIASGSGSTDNPEPSSSKSEGPGSSGGGSYPLRANLDILKRAIEKHFNPEEDDSEDDSEYEASEDSEDDDDEDDDDDDNVGSQSDTEDDSDENEDDGDDEGDAESEGKRCKVLSKKQRKGQENRAVTTSSDEESEEKDYDSDEDEGSNGSQSGSGEDEEDDEDDDGGDLLSGGLLSVAKFRQSLKSGSKVHSPGMDSGCTVVVALVKDGNVYVASAGDSRCIVVMRDGKCVPMSFDHKPENKIELTRITKAGGFVSEGRVNGGLNLSRAFGDFTYKSPKRPAPEQMITPCPDVKITSLDPKEVGYIFLACDGIWNSMKNNQVATFIRHTEPRVNDLSDVCAALFKACLAPTTDGDGTGCDNMTCILVKYDNPNEKEESSTNNKTDLKSTTISDENKKTGNGEKEDEASESKDESSSKRQAEAEPEDDRHHNKKRCLRLLESEVLMKDPAPGSPGSSMATNLTSEQSQEE